MGWPQVPGAGGRAAACVLSPPSVEASATCADCHEDIVDSLSQAPHRLTLRSATDPALLEKFAGREVELLGRRFAFEEEQGRLYFRTLAAEADGVKERRVSVDWIFGSGHHALTPVTTTQTPDGKTTLTQLMATWYADGAIGAHPRPGRVGSTAFRIRRLSFPRASPGLLWLS